MIVNDRTPLPAAVVRARTAALRRAAITATLVTAGAVGLVVGLALLVASHTTPGVIVAVVACVALGSGTFRASAAPEDLRE